MWGLWVNARIFQPCTLKVLKWLQSLLENHPGQVRQKCLRLSKVILALWDFCLFVCLCFLNAANQGIRLEGQLFKPSSKSYDCGISVCVYQFSDSKNCFCLVHWKQSSHTSAGATHLGLFRCLAKSIIMELDQKRNTWQYYNPQLHSLPPVLATGSFKLQVTGMFMNCLMCFFLCIYNIICMFISTL